MKSLSFYITLLVLASACKKDEYETHYLPSDKAYFSYKVGSYSVFDVVEIIYDDFTNTVDTFTYQMREFNESYFKDNLNRDAMRIDRHTRISDTSAWKYQNTWYAVLDWQMAERVEDNKRLVKLSFPITIEAVWNANAFNMDNVNTVFYGLMHEKYEVNNHKFDSAISVESASVVNNFRERIFKEVYAKDIGLVYKNSVFIDKNGSLKRGYRLQYKLNKHVP